jgi:hypothetical protein
MDFEIVPRSFLYPYSSAGDHRPDAMRNRVRDETRTPDLYRVRKIDLRETGTREPTRNTGHPCLRRRATKVCYSSRDFGTSITDSAA